MIREMLFATFEAAALAAFIALILVGAAGSNRQQSRYGEKGQGKKPKSWQALMRPRT